MAFPRCFAGEAAQADPLRNLWQERARWRLVSHEIFAQMRCHKIEKSGSKPFPKRIGVGNTRPHPVGVGPGLPSQGAFRDGEWRGWPRQLPVSEEAAFSQGMQWLIAGWSSPVARQAHNLKVASSNLAPATRLTLLGQQPRGVNCMGGNRHACVDDTLIANAHHDGKQACEV